MNFVAPYMLWGTLAAGVPIALHFFFRSRYRTVPWAAMKFLLLSVEQTSRRLKFQELLLLIVRCLILALLALALARPLFSSVASSGREAVDAVLVIDTSFSMGIREGKQTRLDFARGAALAVIDHLPPHSTVQVVTCADRATRAEPAERANLDHARAYIKKIELTHLASDLAPGISEAISALQRGISPNKELYILSDMHKLAWDRNASQLNKALKDLSAKATVHLVRCGSQQPRNVAVVGIAPQAGIPRPGERVSFAVTVRNTGSMPVRNLRVALAVDGQARDIEEQPIPELPAGESRAVTLTAKMGKSGLRVLTATVKHDDLDVDNRLDQVIQVREQLRVLVVDGRSDLKEPARSSAYHLEHALVPVKGDQRDKYHIRLTSLPPRRVSAGDLKLHDVCVLVNVALERGAKGGGETPPQDFVEQLAPFVRRGNGLILFAGDNVAAEPYNRILGKRLGLLPAKVTGIGDHPGDSFILFDRNSIDAPALMRFREDEDYKGLSFLPILKALDLEEPSKEAKESEVVRVLMRYNNGKPALVTRKVEGGEVLLVGTASGPEWKAGTELPTWNYLSRWPGYIPLVEALLNHLLHRQRQKHNLTVGDTLTWHPAPDPQAQERPAVGEGVAQVEIVRSYVLIHPPDKPGAEPRRVPLGRPEPGPGRQVVTATGLERAGVYYLTEADRAEGGTGDAQRLGKAGAERQPLMVPFAVAPDLRESANLETLAEGELNERLGFTPVHMTSDGRVNVVTATERTNREWTLWLLVAVLVLVLGESVLAWFCGRAW